MKTNCYRVLIRDETYGDHVYGAIWADSIEEAISKAKRIHKNDFSHDLAEVIKVERLL